MALTNTTYATTQMLKKAGKRPMWFIGSEEEFLRACEAKKTVMMEPASKLFPNEYLKSAKTTSSNLSSAIGTMPFVQTAKTVTADTHKRIPCIPNDTQYNYKDMEVLKPKKIAESISDCDDCYRNQPLLPAPSLERLLPIGSARSTG